MSSLEYYEADDEVVKKYPDVREKYLFVGPKKYCITKEFRPFYDDIFRTFEVRSDDVWVFGVPRSGTTLAQEMVWLLGNNLDYEKAAADVLDVRFPVLECAMFFKDDYQRISQENNKYNKDIAEIAEKLTVPAWEKLAEMKSRRFIKTHIPMSLMHPDLIKSGCKIVYLARNPKDVCVSNYLLLNAFSAHASDESFEDFWSRFRDGLKPNGPYFDHVKEGWDLRNHKNILFLFYEEYTKDMKRTIKTIADFLETKITEDQLNKLEDHLKIENFKKNKSVNNDHLRYMGMMKNEDGNFIRKGKVGGWREYFKGSLEEDADRWIQDNLKRTGMTFPKVK